MLSVILSLIVSTASAQSTDKMFVLGDVNSTATKIDATKALLKDRGAMVYECAEQVFGRKNLENKPGDKKYIIGAVSGTDSKVQAMSAALEKRTVYKCTRKVLNEFTGNLKNF